MKKLRAKLGYLRRLPRQKITDYRRVRAIKNSSPKAKRIYYFGVPEHSNLGDLAQCYCIRRYFKKYFPEYEVVEVATRNYLDNSFSLRDYLKEHIRKEDLIFFQSGYCTQDIGGREDIMHQVVMFDFPENRLTVLPQTVYFRSKSRYNRASKIYNSHKKLFFLARDDVSFKTAIKMFPDIRVEPCPDIVTTLIGHYNYDFERDGVLFCVRNDSEKLYSDEQISSLINNMKKHGRCDRLDTTIKVENYKIMENLGGYIEGYFKKFAQYKLIITDRYHGTIFSLISNTPVIVIATTDHKVKTGVDWFKGVYDDKVFFAETLEECEQLAEKILSSHSYTANAPYFEEKYYSVLRQKVEEI